MRAVGKRQARNFKKKLRSKRACADVSVIDVHCLVNLDVGQSQQRETASFSFLVLRQFARFFFSSLEGSKMWFISCHPPKPCTKVHGFTNFGHVLCF